MGETTVLIRLGRVLYWAACAITGLIFLAGLAMGLTWDGPTRETFEWIGAGGLAAGLAWITGRALRYVLANE
jgi:hypothetical protein